MYKQEAIAVLRERMRGIPPTDTLHGVVLCPNTERSMFARYSNPAEAEAVETLGRNFTPSFLLGQDDADVCIRGHTTFCQILDGDMELIITGPAEWQSPSFGDEYQRVLLQRRQPRLHSSTNVIPVALRIPAEYRDLLPATAGIVATEGKFVIIASRASSDELRKLSDGEHLRAIHELQQYFASQWANDTRVVFRMPAKRADEVSRTEKSRYFYEMHCENPIAGYADYIVTACYSIQRYELGSIPKEVRPLWAAEHYVTITQYGPSASGDTIEKVVKWKGGEELLSLLGATKSLREKVIESISYSG